MITPAYALTATERVLPRLALDFTTGVLDSRVTVARALNTATAINSSGFIATVNANLPRFDYDPVTLAPKGLLIEETRTNVLTYSQDWSNAAWVKNNVLLATETILAPDGLVSVDKIIANTVNIAKFTAQTGLTSTTGTFSVYVKPAGETVISLWLVNATVGASFTLTGSGSTALLGATASTITPVANGWYRCTVYHTVASTTAHVYLRTGSSFVGDGVSGVYLRAAQFEAGAFATSYIPTTTTSLTRNADQVTMTGTNFSGWYNASEGTFVARYLTFANAATNNPRVFEVSDGTTSNRSRCYVTATGALTQVSSGGSSVASLGVTLSNPLSAYNQVCFAYKLDSFVLAGNGGTPDTDTLGAVPVAPIRINLGCDINGAAQTQLNGYLARLYYYGPRLLNAEARAFSKEG